MKNVFRMLIMALCLCAVSSMAYAESWGEIREAKSNLNVREKRSPKSEHVVTLTKGQRVKVDFLKDGWVAVFNLNETKRDEKRAIGYCNAKMLIPVALNEVVETEPQAAPLVVPQEPVQKDEPAALTGEGEIKAQVAAAPSPEPIDIGVDPSRVPIKITSDRMVYDENGKMVSFVGNVVAEHGELTLWADKLSAFFSSKTNKKFTADSIDRISAEGNVRAKKGKTEGKCGKLTYLVGAQILKMENDPILQDGPNSLTGDEISFFVRENRSEVVGGNGKRVRAIFMTPEKLKVQ